MKNLETKVNDLKALIEAIEWANQSAKSLYEEQGYYLEKIQEAKEDGKDPNQYDIEQAKERQEKAEAMERLAEKLISIDFQKRA